MPEHRAVAVGQRHVERKRNVGRLVGHVLELRLQPVPCRAVPGRDGVGINARAKRALHACEMEVGELTHCVCVPVLDATLLFEQLGKVGFGDLHIAHFTATGLAEAVLLLFKLHKLGLHPWSYDLAVHLGGFKGDLLEHLARFHARGAAVHPIGAEPARAASVAKDVLRHLGLHALVVGALGGVKCGDGFGHLRELLLRPLIRTGHHVVEVVYQHRGVEGSARRELIAEKLEQRRARRERAHN